MGMLERDDDKGRSKKASSTPMDLSLTVMVIFVGWLKPSMVYTYKLSFYIAYLINVILH
jgi:hypothetical protein